MDTSIKKIGLHFGVSNLLTQWKELFTSKYLFQDTVAGVTVAFVAIPLSLAIALASGVPPGVGLATAIIAGIVCGLFGGTPLAVSGPAAAMSVIIASNVQEFGVEGLTLICLIAGALQLLSGFLGLGKFSRFVPLPVIAGFTAGIGFIILVGQLPRAFGLLPPDQAHTFSVFLHLRDYFHEINLVCFGLVISTFLIIRGFQKYLPKIPAILSAVIITSLVAYFFKFNVPLIGEIPRSLPSPHIPWLGKISFTAIFFNALAVYLLASLETLLSSSAVDKLANCKKHDSNQELIGQGLGNMTVSLFGGMPVTGVIARSAMNVRAGAKTRRASIIHSLIILLTVYFIAPIISLIPIASLAGVLFSVAFSMISYKEFHGLWATSRSEGFIYLVTFLTIIFTDLIAGIQAGIIVASLIVLFKATRTKLHVSTNSEAGILRITLAGSLTFLSVGDFADLENHFQITEKNLKTIILDVSRISDMDSSGAAAIVDLFTFCKAQNLKFYIKGIARRFEPLVKVSGGEDLLNHHYLISENDLKLTELQQTSFYGQLLHGVQSFHKERKLNDRRLYDYLIAKQNPHTLFITCSDSRILTSVMTSSDPGELFIVRNVGNYIPAYSKNSGHSEAAAIEFALGKLDITDVVVCGHANCGAMAACTGSGDLSAELQSWIDLIKKELPSNQLDLNILARHNVLNQLLNLKTYPIVQQRLSNQSLTLHAWFFDFDQSLIYEWQDEMKEFKQIAAEEVSEVTIS